MSLTKVTYSMIKGDVANVFDYMTEAQINDVQSNTGSIDVTDACRNAVNTGGSVYFPQGTYKITGTINIPNNDYGRVIFGEGVKTVLVNHISSTTTTTESDLETATNGFSLDVAIFSTGNYSRNLVIQDLKITSNDWLTSNYVNYQTGIFLRASNSTIQNVEIEGLYCGINFQRWSNKVVNAKIAHCGYGIAGNVANALDAHVVMNFCPTGFLLRGSTSVVIRGVIEQCDNTTENSHYGATPGLVLKTLNQCFVTIDGAYLERCGWTNSDAFALFNANDVVLKNVYFSPYSTARYPIINGMQCENVRGNFSLKAQTGHYLLNGISIEKDQISNSSELVNLHGSGLMANGHIVNPKPNNQTRSSGLSAYSTSNIVSLYSSFITNKRGVNGSLQFINESSVAAGEYVEYAVKVPADINSLAVGGFFPAGDIQINVWDASRTTKLYEVETSNVNSFVQAFVFTLDVSSTERTIIVSYEKINGTGTYRAGMFFAYPIGSNYEQNLFAETGNVHTYGSISAGASDTRTVTITGVDPSVHTVKVTGITGSPLQSGLVVSAHVSATDTVSITLTNTTGGALTPAPTGWRISVYNP